MGEMKLINDFRKCCYLEFSSGRNHLEDRKEHRKDEVNEEEERRKWKMYWLLTFLERIVHSLINTESQLNDLELFH